MKTTLVFNSPILFFPSPLMFHHSRVHDYTIRWLTRDVCGLCCYSQGSMSDPRMRPELMPNPAAWKGTPDLTSECQIGKALEISKGTLFYWQKWKLTSREARWMFWGQASLAAELRPFPWKNQSRLGGELWNPHLYTSNTEQKPGVTSVKESSFLSCLPSTAFHGAWTLPQSLLSPQQGALGWAQTDSGPVPCFPNYMYWIENNPKPHNEVGTDVCPMWL